MRGGRRSCKLELPRGVEKTEKGGQDGVKRRRQNTQGRCKKQRRREEQGYSSAANLVSVPDSSREESGTETTASLDSQHPHQGRGLASKNGSHLHPLRPTRDGQMVCAVTLVLRDW